MKVLASLSILLALLAVSQATAETRSITIGKFTYLGTGTQTRSDGTVIPGVSSYELVFDTRPFKSFLTYGGKFWDVILGRSGFGMLQP